MVGLYQVAVKKRTFYLFFKCCLLNKAPNPNTIPKPKIVVGLELKVASKRRGIVTIYDIIF